MNRYQVVVYINGHRQEITKHWTRWFARSFCRDLNIGARINGYQHIYAVERLADKV